MANILLSYFSDYGESFYDALADTLIQHGNNVYMLNTNSPYISITVWGGESKVIDDGLIQTIVNFNADIIFNFNHSLPRNLYNFLHPNCKICILDADNPETFWNKDILYKNKHKYYYLGFQSKSAEIFSHYLEIDMSNSNYLYMPGATGMYSKNIPIERNVLFIGSNFYPYFIPQGFHFYSKNALKLYHYFKDNFYFTVDDAKKVCPNLSNDEIKWLHEKIKFFSAGQERLKFLQQLTDLDLHIYGKRKWEKIAYYDLDIAACLNYDLVPSTLEDNLYLYNSSKISLNISHPQAKSSFSWRVMDIMASNSCLLMERKTDWLDLFSEYISEETLNSVIYDDRFDMRNKAIRLLNDENLRLKCVKELNNAISKNGRWDHRLDSLQNFLGINLKNQNNAVKYVFNKPTDNKIRIYAVVHTAYTNTYDTLYYEAKTNPLFEWTFVLVPYVQDTYKVTMQELELMMKKKNYPYIKGYLEDQNSYVDIRPFSPDIVLIQTPYDFQRVSSLYSSTYFSSFAKCFYVSYGCSMVDYDLPPYDNLHSIQSDDCISLHENQEFTKYISKYKSKACVSIGYLKCDKYLNYKDNPDFKFMERPDYDVILSWKPRWLGTIGDSNFLTYINYFIEYAKKHTNHLVYIMLHDLMKNEVVVKRRIFTKQAYDNMIYTLKSIDNIRLLEGDDFLDIVFFSDIFIGDYSSTIMEFALTGKPVIYTALDVYLSDYGKKILEGFYVVNNTDDMNNILSMLIEQKSDRLQNIRKKNIGLLSDAHENLTIAQYCLEYFSSLDFKKQRTENMNTIKCVINTSTSIENRFLYKVKNKIKDYVLKHKLLLPLYPFLKRVWKLIK